MRNAKPVEQYQVGDYVHDMHDGTVNEHRFVVSRHGRFVFRTDWMSGFWEVDRARALILEAFGLPGYEILEDIRPTVIESRDITPTPRPSDEERINAVLAKLTDQKLTEIELDIARIKGKIYAIKAVRERTDLGLLEAKVLVERDMGWL
jgi:hypothetical protein